MIMDALQRVSADRMRREAAAADMREQERACLMKAADDYTQAIDIYGKAIGFGEPGRFWQAAGNGGGEHAVIPYRGGTANHRANQSV